MNIKFVLYEIDPTSNRYKKPKGLLQVFWKYRSTIWEMKIYTLADKIIHMKTHALHFSQDIYKVFHDKVSYLDIPTFKNNNSKLEIKYNKPIQSFIYAGAFYPGLREPNYLFNSLSVISKKKKIKVDIYTGKNMLKEIKKLVLARENIFSLHNLVSQSELEKKIIKADVLLSVGNHDSDFLPSKTLYYISSGKPVIHFYSDDNDVSNEYFKKYP